MANENIKIHRPDYFEACKDCAVMNLFAKKMEETVIQGLKSDNKRTGAKITIVCTPHNTELRQVQPVATVEHETRGTDRLFEPDSVTICPGLTN